MARRDDPSAQDLPEALHEVGNALTVVVGWIDLALASLPESGPAVEALEVARGRAARAQQLARRAIGGAPHVDPPRPLARVVREVALGLEVARSGAVRVEVEVAEALQGVSLVRGDAAGQVLTNLVLNALQVSEPGGVVRVRALRVSGGLVELEVADEGPGVPEELQDALFTSGRTSRPDGMGIGLRHASALAQEVGGSLRLAPGAPGGATFQLAWPSAVPDLGLDGPDAPPPSSGPASWPPGIALRAARAAAPDTTGLRGLRLLLVEDDVAVVDLLEAALAARGAQVEVVQDRNALAGALEGAPFDAILVDLSPLGDRLADSLEALRGHSQRARLVVISGSATAPADVPHTDAWVRKPFEVVDVLRALVAPPQAR